MANLEYKQAVLKLTFEGGLTGDGKMKTKSKSYRNILAAATANGLDTVAITLASFSNSPYIGAEKVETSNII
ncbi:MULTISPECIES: DUF1659 domain-containing protein [Bacillaceae]|uniref:DUF1659 domain-containing protein n=1 Tax=Bacillaceae TaxID=186817 RepID=UPI0006AE344F|nr:MULTISPECIES: DUF1659 domain-containing protein [Bacillaceae]ALC85491.1 hypothetical protein AM499_06435 [Bacillus sp. FJAT-22090]KQL35971.1 hypothetical protein AN959_08815 [Psychrobacillus sp. FJAT-21963]MDF2066862.1 DUF1659 domain-containing protein [Bacillus sp. Cr_A10]